MLNGNQSEKMSSKKSLIENETTLLKLFEKKCKKFKEKECCYVSLSMHIN